MLALRMTFLTVSISLLFSGCASTVTSNTARTAKEQMLLSNAVDQSLDKVDFTPLYDQKVFLEEKYLECVDKPYIVGSVRHRAMRAGAHLVDSADGADVVMELRSGGVGTDTTASYIGTPEIALPGMLTIPEVHLTERKSQFGYAKIGLMIYDAKSREILGEGGVSMAQADDSNRYILGVGPFQSGSLKRDIAKAQTRPAGMQRRQLPTTVAFGNRSDVGDAASVRFASDSREAE
ncbi:MAG: DUF6655 family protein [Planctomycetaceae bacterium]